jgi:UDP:flavonoid glycosyltransferase YjiC (YdhE family)
LRSRFHEPGLPVPDGKLLPLRWARSLCWRGIDAVIDTRVKTSLNQFRKAIGLAPVRRPFNFWVYSPDLNLGLFPEWYGPCQPDWPATTALTGFPILAPEDTTEIPDDLAQFFGGGAPPVIFTQGSHSPIADPFFHAGVEACQKLRLRGVLAGVRPEFKTESLPDSVMSCAFVPFNKVLPRAAAIVHHGGVGTTAQSLWAGIPQVIVPLFDDQFYNARRVEQLGAGQRLSKRKLAATTLAGTLQRVLESQWTVQRCREIASWMRQRDPMEEACHHIEQYWEQARTEGLPRC